MLSRLAHCSHHLDGERCLPCIARYLRLVYRKLDLGLLVDVVLLVRKAMKGKKGPKVLRPKVLKDSLCLLPQLTIIAAIVCLPAMAKLACIVSTQ